MSIDHYAKASRGAAISRGLKNAIDPTAVATRAQARVVKEQADQELMKVKATAPTQQDLSLMQENQTLQLQILQEQQQTILADNAKLRTFEALSRYEVDGDLSHLNKAITDLRKNPLGARVVNNVARVDYLTERDTQLLDQLGLSVEQFKANPVLQKSFFKTISTDGKVGISSLEGLAIQTGYANHRTKQAREAALKDSIIYKNTRAGKSNGFSGLTQDEAEAKRITDLARPSDTSEADWQQGNRAYDTEYQRNFSGIVSRDARTATEKQRLKVRQTKAAIDKKAGGPEKFFDIDFSNRSNRLKYENDIQDILTLGKIDFSAKDVQSLHNIRELTALSNPAGDLSQAETGILDNILFTTKKYLSNASAGVAERAAYGAFRNTIRHALYGSALTASEIEAFNEQFGTTGQQLGPLLAQFKINIEQIKHKLESIQNLGDSYVSHFYLNADEQKVDHIINALDERLEYLSTYKPQESLSDEDKKADELYKSLYPGS